MKRDANTTTHVIVAMSKASTARRTLRQPRSCPLTQPQM